MFWIELTKDYLGKKAGERLALDEKDAQPLVAAGIARAVPDDPLGGATGPPPGGKGGSGRTQLLGRFVPRIVLIWFIVYLASVFLTFRRRHAAAALGEREGTKKGSGKR
jgi:hypothetical protein